jgi:hypothetical protein
LTEISVYESLKNFEEYSITQLHNRIYLTGGRVCGRLDTSNDCLEFFLDDAGNIDMR